MLRSHTHTHTHNTSAGTEPKNPVNLARLWHHSRAQFHRAKDGGFLSRFPTRAKIGSFLTRLLLARFQSSVIKNATWRRTPLPAPSPPHVIYSARVCVSVWVCECVRVTSLPNMKGFTGWRHVYTIPRLNYRFLRGLLSPLHVYNLCDLWHNLTGVLRQNWQISEFPTFLATWPIPLELDTPC